MTRPISLLIACIYIASLVGGLVVPSSRGSEVEARKRRQTIHNEIVGGTPVTDNRYSFVAAIGSADPSGGLPKDNQFCGGSLISPSYVLTAAHCVVGWGPERFAVVVGRTDLTSNEGEVRSVADVAVHPDYDRVNSTNDIALLHLSQPITNIEPIDVVGVNDGRFDEVGTSLTLAGYGDLGSKGSQNDPDRLHENQLSVIDDATCAKQWRRTGYSKNSVWPLMLCTTAKKFGSGDSGGPLFATTNGKYIQVGMVSGSFDGKSEGRKLKNIPDYGPQLSAPSSADFIDSIAGHDIAGGARAAARHGDKASSVSAESQNAKKDKQGKQHGGKQAKKQGKAQGEAQGKAHGKAHGKQHGKAHGGKKHGGKHGKAHGGKQGKAHGGKHGKKHGGK